jgi:GT2 family glycosyltransferase
VEGLIQKLDKTQDPATMALLTEVASDQTLRLPKSAGWHLYPQWFEAFQRLEGLDAPTLQCHVGVLIVSAGDSELEQITIDSIGADQCHIHHLATASPSDLSESLQKLLDAGCDCILPMAAGDRLAPKALPYLAALLDDGSAWGFADCDQDGPQDQRTMPWLKPVWDIDFFIGADIYSPGSIFTRMVIEKALTLSISSTKDSKLSWYSFLAGIAYATELDKLTVSHLPRIIYHRRRERQEHHDLAELSPERRESVEWLCEKLAPGARVSHLKDYPALTRAHWPLPKVLPRVSLIVPTRDQFKLLCNCIEGLLKNTDYTNIEIIVVNNQSSDLQTLEYLDSLPQRGVKVIDYPHPFNYSIINNHAAQHATGEIIGLINNDIEIIDSSWLKEMVSQLSRPGIGAVGAKLLWPNGMVQHGGVIIGINGLAAHSGNNLSEGDAGYLWTNLLTRQQSAVTAACLLLRKSLFDDLQGLDGSAFPVAFNDVDLCLRIREQGYKVVWTANARLTHAESASRGKDLAPEKRSRAHREQINFMTKWTDKGQQDPYYHPAISTDYLSGPYGGLAIPMRSVRPRSNGQQA